MSRISGLGRQFGQERLGIGLAGRAGYVAAPQREENRPSPQAPLGAWLGGIWVAC